MEPRPKKPSDSATAIKHSLLRLFLPLSVLLLVCASLLRTAGFPHGTAGFPHASGSDSGLLEMGRAAKLSHAPNAPAEIKVVSYNIRWRGGEELRELVKLFRGDSEIGAATILGLQEVDRNKKRTGNLNTVKLIAEELGKHYAWAAPPTPKENLEEETGVAILSSYPLADVNRIVLPHPGPGGRKRVAIGATITAAGAPLRVYSVHSENRISVEKKIDQTKAVLKDLARYPKDMRAIILGDLNTWEPSAVKKTSALFAGENFTTPFANDKSTFLRMVLVVPIRFKLDWIWLRGLDTTSHGIDKKIGLSDHWPLWTVIRLKPPGTTK